MAHVTFIHGIANKPAPDELRRIWLRALEDAVEPLSLSDAGVTTSMVYWADLMYEEPIQDTSSFEGVLENTPAAVDGGGNAPMPVPANNAEADFIAGLREELTGLDDEQMTDVSPAVPATPGAALERIPLPWALKRPIMNAFLRDVHHYLFDTEFGPPGRPKVHIQQTIRKRFVDTVCNKEIEGPHVVVSHSMGTVIAYDCLKRVADCAQVDGLITIGCPLGLDEVQDKLQPGWTRPAGYPSERLAKRWVNLFDRLDPVCGFDPELANDFQFNGGKRVEDIAVQNSGAWRHSGTKYLAQPKFCQVLRAMLEI